MYGKYREHHFASSPSEKRKTSRIVLVESTGKRVLDQSRLRLFCVALVFTLSFVAISIRLVEVGMLRGHDGDGVQTLAEYRASKPRNPRADITDRNGEVLATTLETASLYAIPRQIGKPIEVAEDLAKIFPEMHEKDLAKRLSSGRSFAWIKRHITPRQQKLVNDLGVPGLNFESEYKRIYPHANLFSHVLGYVDVDAHGIAGMEKAFDKKLRNESGEEAPLELSVDLRIQSILREEMQAAVKDFQALGATGVVMDIHSGEIIAMSSLPDFDPHEPGRAKDEDKFNRATLGVYEMGSTFKTFTMAVALESGVANMQTSYDATKPIKVARFTISDSHPENRWLSVPEIFAYSSNIGTVKMILDVGAARQQEFLRKVGFLEPVELELPEKGAPLVPNPWREINMMTIAYGHGLAVTPLHLIRAIASITGDGTLVPVTLLKGGSEGKARKKVLSPGNVGNIRKLLRLVVDYGTGSKADAKGYRVGGKTGTAEKLSGGGAYKADSKMASFVGVFPIEDPQYAVLVMVDEPKGNKSTYGFATGGWVSAPVVGKVVGRMGPLLGLRPMFELPSEGVDKKDPKTWLTYDGGNIHAISF